MIVPLTLFQKFKAYEPVVGEIGKRVKESLVTYCEHNHYAFTSRTKSIDSLAEKIETGRFKSWSDLDDFFACTIIIPTLAEESSVIKHCQATFDVQNTTKRGQTKKQPDVFRFDSTRMTCRLRRPEGFQDSDGSTIYDINFEIQIKSAFEHAWSVTTHALSYKSDVVDWKRLRLSAQIKATVEQLDMLILSFNETVPFVSENPWPEVRDKKKIAVKLQSYFDSKRIPSELAPKDMSRLCDNIYSLLRANNKVDNIDDFLRFISAEIELLDHDMIPRSISLFQFLTGLMVEQTYISQINDAYNYHVTPELVTLYPKVANVKSIFNYGQT